MRLLSLGLIGLFSTSALAAACGSSVDTEATGGAGGTSGSATNAGGSTNVGSSANSGSGTSSSSSGPIPGYPAPHPPLPTVVSLGGPVLSAPKFIPVYFSNDDPAFTPQITDFYSKIGASAYWAANVSEYGVGPAKSGQVIQLATPMTGTITDGQIQQWLANKINTDQAFASQLDANAVYGLMYPTGVSIQLTSGGKIVLSCQQFGGYHSNVQFNGKNVPYMVLPRCPSFNMITGIDALTAALSHEMVEAATDPYPQSTPAYAQVNEKDFHWLFALGGGETGDMCAQLSGSFYKDPTIGNVVQRSWSNKAGQASNDPCVPALPGAVYFNSAPVFPDMFQLNVGKIVNVQGVKIPVGGSRSVELDLYSEAPTAGPWTLQALDYDQLTKQGQGLSFTFDKNSGVNGDKINMTITVLKKSPYGVGLFILTSTLGTQKALWVGLVGY